MLVFSTSCSSIRYASDYDGQINFEALEDFHYIGWSDNSDELINDFDKKRIEEAFGEEFKKRGIHFVDESEADAAVSLFIVFDEKTSVTAYTNHNNFYGYGSYRYPAWGWGGGMSTTTYQENDYTVGTLVVDVFDAQTKQLVWQGVASGTVNENPRGREERIIRVAKGLMLKYPVQPTADK